MAHFYTFIAWGKQFRPSQIDFAFTESNDPGDIGKIGRYKGEPIPYGSIEIKVSNNIDYMDRLIHLTRVVKSLLPQIITAGATDMYFDIARFDATTVFNEGYSTEQLSALASLNCDVHYSAYTVSEEEEAKLWKEYEYVPKEDNPTDAG